VLFSVGYFDMGIYTDYKKTSIFGVCVILIGILHGFIELCLIMF